MTDEAIPSLVCPRCGRQLLGPTKNIATKADDMLLCCPIHGDAGRLDRLAYQLGQEAARTLIVEYSEEPKIDGPVAPKDGQKRCAAPGF